MAKETWDEQMQGALRVYFSYDPETGIVSRRLPTKRVKAGPLTARTARGSIQTNFTWMGRLVNIAAHRLAYFLHTGFIPQEVLHKDRDLSNNKFDNLIAIFDRNTTVMEGIKQLPVIQPTIQPLTQAAAPVNVPVTITLQPAAKKKWPLVLDMERWGELLTGEFNKGVPFATESPIGGLLFKQVNGEILPYNYDYWKQSREEQLRVRRGWMVWAYYKKMTPTGAYQAELDQEQGLPMRWPSEQMIRPQNEKDGGPKPVENNLSPEQVLQLEGPLPDMPFVPCGTYEYNANPNGTQPTMLMPEVKEAAPDPSLESGRWGEV